MQGEATYHARSHDIQVIVRSIITMFSNVQNVGPPADLATSLRPLALRLPRKTPLMPSRAATAERDGVMRRVDVASCRGSASLL